MPQDRKRTKSQQGSRRDATAKSSSEPRLEDRTRVELYEMAHRLEIAGATEMSKPELIEAIRRR
jgi:hypothetical protein